MAASHSSARRSSTATGPTPDGPTRYGGHRGPRLPARQVRPGLPRLRHPRTRLDEHLPLDHRLSRIYRFGAGLIGLSLLVFGVLSVVHRVGFFSTGDESVAGLDVNGALGVLSIVVGCGLLVAMVLGGNVASTLNLLAGIAFLLSGFTNLALLETSYNLLNFSLANVLFSFVVGLLLMTFGMYGRVGSRLPHQNPYWRDRHPQLAAREDRCRQPARRPGEGGAVSPPTAGPRSGRRRR